MKILSVDWDKPNSWTLDTYKASGGYTALLVVINATGQPMGMVVQNGAQQHHFGPFTDLCRGPHAPSEALGWQAGSLPHRSPRTDGPVHFNSPIFAPSGRTSSGSIGCPDLSSR